MSGPGPGIAAAVPNDAEAGRAALAGHAWSEAFDHFSRANQSGQLSGADLEAFAQAAFFSAHADEEPDIAERAFKAHLEEGNVPRAAVVALGLARDYGHKGKASIASAWARRAERLLETEPEGYAHGYLALVRADMARNAGEPERAIELAEQALAIATRTKARDLHTSALVSLGLLRIATGATSEGLGLLEEATIAAVNGEASPVTTGIACCSLIGACRDLTDYQRATEWIEATDRWCERESVPGFPGVCRVHRGEVVALSGAWDRAEQELRRATEELAAYNAVPPMADGFYAIADIRRMKGDLAGAEQAYRQAHALGRSPQPGLALVRLAAGNVKAAAAAINAAVEGEWDQWAKVRLLAAQVEIALAAGDAGRASAAAQELDRLVDSYPTRTLEAIRHQAAARVLLAEGDGAAAVRRLRSAIRLATEVGAPYDVARARQLLARALRQAGDHDDADLELQAARDEFARLGAAADLAAAEREMRTGVESREGITIVRKTLMFTDIVGSTSLAAALGDEAWGRMLRWHDETLQRLVRERGGEVVKSTGDGFFVVFESASRAVDAAIAIQRALSEHREQAGFAPAVRIGLHAADAAQRGDDYLGVAVNTAARVAGIGAGGEIVATADTLSEAGDPPASGLREVSLRGLQDPVRVASLTWS